MTEWEFTITIDGPDLGDDRHLDALFEAGCGDATFGSVGGVQLATFHRAASSFAEAVSAAISAVEGPVPGARVVSMVRGDAPMPAR